MQTNAIQQEILLVIGTSFSYRTSCENNTANLNNLTTGEQLEEACWNGEVQEMLPEICKPSERKLSLLYTRETNAFIEIELGEIAEAKERQFSIDPYLFLTTYFYS